uniref:Uncharacterized protein n=1 Tax=Solanum lycopersicum TaxID=4081 RepID=A0A3Q7F7E8_SOLLC
MTCILFQFGMLTDFSICNHSWIHPSLSYQIFFIGSFTASCKSQAECVQVLYSYKKPALITQEKLHDFLKSSMTTCAALRPGAPITPPPGCVPLPHKYRPSIGVR